MGNCSSREVSQPQTSKKTSVNDWDSVSFHEDRESDMISLDRLFKSEDAQEMADVIDSSRDGATTSVSDGPMVEEDGASTSNVHSISKSNKKVTFVEEKDVLQELYTDETLLEKKRKSFGADLTLFSEMLKET